MSRSRDGAAVAHQASQFPERIETGCTILNSVVAQQKETVEDGTVDRILSLIIFVCDHLQPGVPMDTVDIESLVHLEQSFYDEGYEDGFAHGRIHGLIEGRALGREKGYEMFEELGFYEGFALTWKRIYESTGRSEDRTMHNIRVLLDAIAQFPRTNPSPSGSSSESDHSAEVDIPRLFRQIRARYKTLCATLGVRPSLRAADNDSQGDADSGGSMQLDSGAKPKKVWQVDSIGKRATGSQQLSF